MGESTRSVTKMIRSARARDVIANRRAAPRSPFRVARLLRAFVPSATLAISLVFCAAPGLRAEPAHGISMHGKPALPADMTALPYANPQAPQGGTLTIGNIGRFDNLNPFIIKGVVARGLRDSVYGNNVFESLLERNYDEPFALYGLIADSVDMPDDRTSVTFHLDPAAHFSDGKPITVDDVIFSFETLRDKGRPNHRAYYGKVDHVERIGDRGIRFVFVDGSDRELPLILGLMPVLPSHFFDRETFDRTTLNPVVGSGPYVISEVDAGTRLVLTRDPNYWGRDLPINRGRYNFDTLRFDYFRDQTALFESFKKGLVDILPENDPARWATAFDFPAVTDGNVIKDAFSAGTPKPMFAFAFNTRREIFADKRVREAFGYFLDFAWINKNLYFGLYDRTGSYFQGSELASPGHPASDAEKSLLAPFAGVVSPDIMAGTWTPPATDGTGRDRNAIRKGLKLLAEAGWRIRGGRLVNDDGKPFTLEILVPGRDQERLALTYARSLKRIGIEVTVRSVDSTQYQQRLQVFDYDMILATWASSLSPGNEQIFRWSSASASQDGSFNFTGAREPALDAMIDAMLNARDRPAFVAAVRAFDRVLLSGFYVVPLFHVPENWVARWSRIEHPEKTSLYGQRYDTWWHGRDK